MKNLNDLEVFERVVAHGNMSAAGRELGLSPAVVSKKLKRLELQLGTRLLQRTTRQISLTETGQEFHKHVVSILAAIQEAESLTARYANKTQGTLKISAPTSFGRMHIAPHLNKFMNQNPELSVQLLLTDDMVDIISGGFDLAIRIGALPDSSLVAKKLAPVERILCASPKYIQRNGEPKTLDDLAEHFCIPNHNSDHWRLSGPEGTVFHRPSSRLQTNSSEVVRECVMSGLGIALRSTWDVGVELATGELNRVLPQYNASRGVGVYALYASRQFLPMKVRLFIDYMNEVLHLA